jgi:F-type H+-transporting ATPase subunit a
VAEEQLAPAAEHEAADRYEPSAGPMEHAQDYALFGVDAHGRFLLKSEMYDRHGQALASYQPFSFGAGPLQGRLEFTRHMLDLTIVAVLLGAVLVAVARRVLAGARADRAPEGPLANAVEYGLIFVRDDIVKPIGGEHLARFTPLYLTYFFFILLCNLSGIVPQAFKGPTSNLAVTGALALTVLVFLMFLGIKRQGPVGYFRSLVPSGIPWLLWPMIFLIEFAGSLLRCAILAVRLFANMLVGHLVLPSVLGLAVFKPGAAGMAAMGLAVGVPLALGLSLLELLICLIQAYVFTMLSMIFTSAAVHPEH